MDDQTRFRLRHRLAELSPEALRAEVQRARRDVERAKDALALSSEVLAEIESAAKFRVATHFGRR